MTNIFVRNFPYSTTEEGLHALFAEFGQVASAKIIRDRDSGDSRGFGFVEMTSHDDAGRAIKKLDGFKFEGRQLSVEIARPKENGRRAR